MENLTLPQKRRCFFWLLKKEDGLLQRVGVLEVKALLHCYCLRNDATNLCIYFAGACHAIFITPPGG